MSKQYFEARAKAVKSKIAKLSANAEKWGFEESVNHKALIAKLEKAACFYDSKGEQA